MAKIFVYTPEYVHRYFLAYTDLGQTVITCAPHSISCILSCVGGFWARLPVHNLNQSEKTHTITQAMPTVLTFYFHPPPTIKVFLNKWTKKLHKQLCCYIQHILLILLHTYLGTLTELWLARACSWAPMPVSAAVMIPIKLNNTSLIAGTIHMTYTHTVIPTQNTNEITKHLWSSLSHLKIWKLKRKKKNCFSC